MESITTYLLYNFILVAAGSFAYLAEHGNTKQFRLFARIIVFLIMWIPASIRYYTGTDYGSYVEIYNGTFPFVHIIEGSYLYLNNAVRSLGLSVQWIFVFTSFIIYFPICFILKREYYFFAILFYILLFIYLRSYNVVRQAMSFSFLTGALIYFGDKKYIKFFLFIIPAISFHISSVFILPVLALGFVRFKKRIFPIAVTFFGMIILYNIDILSILFFFLKIFNSKYLRYSAYIAGDTYHLQSGTILTFFAVIVRSLMVFLAVYFYSDISKKDKKTVFILNMSIIYSYLGMLSLHHRIIGRLRQAFEFVPFLVGGYAFQPLKKYKKIIMYVIILLNVGLFENTILRSNRETVGAGVYPYYSVFSKDK